MKDAFFIMIDTYSCFEDVRDLGAGAPCRECFTPSVPNALLAQVLMSLSFSVLLLYYAISVNPVCSFNALVYCFGLRSG